MATPNGADPQPRSALTIRVSDGQALRVVGEPSLIALLREANEVLKSLMPSFPADGGALVRLVERCIRRAEDVPRATVLRDLVLQFKGSRRELVSELRAFENLAGGGVVPALTPKMISLCVQHWGKLEALGAPSYYAESLWSKIRDALTLPTTTHDLVNAYAHLITLNLAFRHTGGPTGEASPEHLFILAAAMVSPDFDQRPSGAIGTLPFRRALELIHNIGVGTRQAYLRTSSVLADLGGIASYRSPTQFILPYLEIAVWAQSRPDSERDAISREYAAMMTRVANREVWPQLLWNLEEAVRTAQLPTSEKVCSAIREIGYRTAATAITDARLDKNQAWLNFDWDSLSPAFRVRPHSLLPHLLPVAGTNSGLDRVRVLNAHGTYQTLTKVAPAHGLSTWARLDNAFHGFSTFTYDCKSLPSGCAAPLVQFGSDLGRVRFLNVRDPKIFPGPGFMIDRLDLRRMFPVPSGASIGNEFAPYEHAWPGLADGFESLAEVSVLFARGVIALTCSPRAPQAKTDKWLVIPNVHFGNPLSIPPTLMPGEEFRKLRLLEALGEGGANSGSGAFDLSSVSNALRIASTAYGVVPVGAASFLAQLAVTMPPEYRNLLDIYDQDLDLDARINEWSDYAPHIRLSAKGRARLESLHDRRSFLDGERRRSAEKMLTGIEKSLVACETALNAMNEAAWLMDRFDQLLLGFAQWKNGHTLPKPREGGELKRIGERSAPEPEVQFSSGVSDSQWQPQSQRMISMVYDIHAQRAREVWDLRQYPVLAVTESTSLSVFPSELPYLDTWDMSVHIGKDTFWLNSQGFDELSERLWHQRFLPLVLDGSKGPRAMKFLPRENVGLARSK